MANRYKFDTTLGFGRDGEADWCEIDVTVSYAVSFGSPATRLDPASDDEVTDITLTHVGGKPAPWGFHHWTDKHFAAEVEDRLFGCIDTLNAMIEAAHEDEAYAADRRDEARAA